MNKVHRVVWNRGTGQWVVAAETARSSGKSGKVTRCMAGAQTLLVGAMALAGSTLVHAADECGPAAISITCALDSYANGILYYPNTTIGNLILDNAAMVVSTQGVLAGSTTSANNVTVMANRFSQIHTTASGVEGRGIMAVSNGQATVHVTGGRITTLASGAHGILASSTQGSSVTVGGDISTLGSDAHGAQASSSEGPAQVDMQSGLVSTAGDNAEGLYAVGGGSIVTISATQSGGSIVTAGTDADGVMAHADNPAATGVVVLASQTGGTIETSGGASPVFNGSSGVAARIEGQGTATASQSAGASIVTQGDFGYGLSATTGITTGQGDVDVVQAGSISTHGVNAPGVYAATRDGHAHVLQEATGSITTTTANSSGIHAESPTNGTSSVTQRGTINSNDEGIAANATGQVTVSQEGGFINATLAGINTNSTAGNVQVSQDAAGQITTTDASAAGIRVQAALGDAAVLQDGRVQSAGVGISISTPLGAANLVRNDGQITAVGDGVQITSGTASVTNTGGSINSTSGDGIDLSGVTHGSTVINSGNITATSAGNYAIRGSASGDRVTTTAGTIRGDIGLGAGNDQLVASGGSLVGSTFMDSGNDTVLLAGRVDISRTPRFDGGAGDDALTLSGLSVRGFTGATDDLAKGNNLTGWETINVVDGGTLKLTGDLFEAGPAGVRQLNIDSGATLDLKGGSPGVFTINGSLDNAGTVTFQDGAGDDQATLTGNYGGNTGSVILFDTVFRDDASATDRLNIQGDVSGQSTLNINNIGGSGAQTTNGIQLIQVDGSSDSSNFRWDIGNLQVGNYQYVLQQGSAADANDWYLVSAVVPCEQNNTCPAQSEGPTPLKSTGPLVYAPGTAVPLWRPAISAYSVARSMNADVGFMQTATLHQRQGDLNVQGAEQGKAWGRFLAQDLTGKGRDRFSYDQESQGFQFGNDLRNSSDEQGTRSRMGWLGHYVSSHTDTWDRVRPTAGLPADTGLINTKSYGLGGYKTEMKSDGSYTDWVGHLNLIKNDFSVSYGDKAMQKGWQLALGVEKGVPLKTFQFASGTQWTVEGQGQAVLLHTRYGAFEDTYSRMKGESFDALRTRAGVRVHNGQAWDGKGQTDETQYYGIAHLVHDLVKTRQMTLSAKQGGAQVKAGETFDQTYLELGVGVQTKASDAAWLWVDARYEAGLRNRKDTSKLSLGFKKSF